MLDMTFSRKITALLDDCHADHLRLESDVLASTALGLTRARQGERMKALLDHQFEAMDRLMGEDAIRYREASLLLKGHPLYRDVFLQSAVVAQRRSGITGGPFGLAFRRIVSERPELGYSPYAEMLNQALLDLPFCAAMRNLTEALRLEIAALPEGARVLGLGCGPAVEIMSLPVAMRARLDIQLCDSDPLALQHVRRHGGAGLRLSRLDDAPRFDRQPRFDFIYSQTLLAFRPAVPPVLDDPARDFVGALFSGLADGGRLVLAAPLASGGGNPHRPAHRMLLEASDSPVLVYRSPADIVGLTAGLAAGSFSARLTQVDLVTPIGGGGVFAVLILEAGRA